MRLVRKLHTFWKLSRRTRVLFFKAVFISAIVKFALVFLPFRVVLKWLGKINSESDLNINQECEDIRIDIKRALALCEKYTFWKTECYTMALTGKLLLRFNNCPSTVYIGFYKNEKGVFEGHAWLKSCNNTVFGESDQFKFTVQACFT